MSSPPRHHRLLAGLALLRCRDVEDHLVLDVTLPDVGGIRPQDDLAERRLAAAGLARPGRASRRGGRRTRRRRRRGRRRSREPEEAALDLEVLDQVLDADQHLRRSGRPSYQGGRGGSHRRPRIPRSFDGQGGGRFDGGLRASARRRSRASRSTGSASTARGGVSPSASPADARRRVADRHRVRAAALEQTPGGRFSGLGTMPLMTSSRSRFSPRRGIEASRPFVYGWCGRRRSCRRRRARRPCRRTSPRPRRPSPRRRPGRA